ncbi:MAG: class I adenylate cyclase [Pseudomonadaceae bacterium]|nr:class I adenylate cyclase [Pseudomonadaceae bacterium]
MALFRPKNQPTTAPDGSEVDRKLLRKIGDAFMAHHQQRANNLALRLDARQRIILEALPLLLHSNHPGLPGHVRASTPCGIDGYDPSRTAIMATSRLASSFVPERLRESDCALQAVFLMGSGGSVGQTRDSDIDLWVCAPRNLHEPLGEKLQALASWTEKQGLTLQGFAVDPDEFLKGSSSSPTPRTLLLDEFYRSGTWLAGRKPLWWLIDAQHPDYAAHAQFLINNRFIEGDDYLDFGDVTQPDASELLSAGLAQLRACFDTPHKSLMKLMLIESYALKRDMLSDSYKRLIHSRAAGEEIPDNELDTYVQLYRHLDAHLTGAGEDARLELLRRCFIRKTAAPKWRETPLPDLLKEWGIEGNALNKLKRPKSWLLSTLAAEDEAIDGELTRAHILLRQLAESMGEIDAASKSAFDGVGRRLRERVSDRPGKLKLISSAVMPRGFEGRLTLSRTNTSAGHSRWRLADSGGTLFQHARLTAVLSWHHLNGLDTSHLQISGGNTEHRTLLRILKENRGAIAFINADSPGDTSDNTLVTSRDDALEFSGFHHNLVTSIDLLIEHDGDWLHHTFTDDTALLQCFCALHTMGREGSWHCVTELRGQLIEQRIKGLYDSFNEALQTNGSGRFLFALGGRFGLIEISDGNAASEILADERALIARLSSPAADPFLYADPVSSRLRLVRDLIDASQDRSALAIVPQKEQLLLYLREHGRIHRFAQPRRPMDEVAASWLLFFASRVGEEPPRILTRSDDKLLAYRPSSVRVPFRLSLTEHSRERFRIRCGDKHWDDVALDDATLDDLTQTILSQRSSLTLYPIYLTEVHLLTSDASLADAMLLKTRTETRLWQRMSRRASNAPGVDK